MTHQYTSLQVGDKHMVVEVCADGAGILAFEVILFRNDVECARLEFNETEFRCLVAQFLNLDDFLDSIKNC